MTIASSYCGDWLSLPSRRLLTSLVSPLCGLSQRISFMSRSRMDPLFAVAGSELTGVHLLRNPNFRGDPPSPFSYHIGGVGQTTDEVYIRCLAETVERYSQLVSGAGARFPIRFVSFDDLANGDGHVLPAEGMRYFTDAQLGTPGFPFQGFDPRAPMGWLHADSLLGGYRLWVPAQLLLLGYQVRRESGEPWLWSAVTTGTATHSNASQALHNALLELIQIDCAVGHWYSDAATQRIRNDRRTAALDKLVERSFRPTEHRPAFHRLPIRGFSCHAVACLVRPESSPPAVGVGLGCARDLEEAMYKALLEAVAVVQLARVVMFVDGGGPPTGTTTFWDFNRNVVHYSKPENAAVVLERFERGETVGASELPVFNSTSIRSANRELVAEFAGAGMELVGMDISAPETTALGLRTLRVWSPGTLGLPPPSAPQMAHGRFRSFGGVESQDPHPYP